MGWSQCASTGIEEEGLKERVGILKPYLMPSLY